MSRSSANTVTVWFDLVRRSNRGLRSKSIRCHSQLIAEVEKKTRGSVLKDQEEGRGGIRGRGLDRRRGPCDRVGQRRILPVSSLQLGAYGLRDVAISVPTVVGRKGVLAWSKSICGPRKRCPAEIRQRLA